MADYVKLTPLAGGKNDISGVCSLLEIGNYTILLDCGCSTKNANNLLHKIQSTLSTIGKSINAVILSHADLQHLGALPVVLGANGISLANTSVVCTLPVHKFGQLVLYDYCSNIEMEGNPDIIKSEFSKKNNHEFPKFDYDDIDHCFYRPTIVKFSQMIELPGSSINKRSQDSKPIHICAYPSGRTIGGAIWRIRHGSTEVLYAVDMNMKNEVVLAGASTDPLPSVPSLLIIDAGTSAQLTTLQTVATAGKGKGRKDKEDPQALISNILDTLRNEGNVLLPCETAGRTLELIQTLGTYWAMNKVGLYHLILLSPMAYNVLEFARSQLEWMRDSLAKQFYNGSSNPFELSYLKICTSVREMERLYPGPKVVLSTDSGLSCGLSKEILLRWGGDPRCRVIFTDASETNSLGYELRTAVPPVVVTINRPIRVELCGEELNEHRKQEERKRKEVEDDEQRKTRENELEFVSTVYIVLYTLYRIVLYCIVFYYQYSLLIVLYLYLYLFLYVKYVYVSLFIFL